LWCGSFRCWNIYHGGTETRRKGRVAADLRGGAEIGQESVGRELARMNTNRGMRLGRVVAAALAVQILMATESSIQQSALSDQSSNGQLANGNWQEQGDERPQRPKPEPVVYGEPLGLAAMAHAPTNEDGVLFLFGVLAAGLGFRVERIQKAFPDCEAKREVAPGKWELVFVEFELYSRNFKEHRHDPKGCHAIVCWKHNWPDCPEWLEVIELSKVVKRLGDRE